MQWPWVPVTSALRHMPPASIHGEPGGRVATCAFGFSVSDIWRNLMCMKGNPERAEDAMGMSPGQRLALAQQAFGDFHGRCFWFMRSDAQVTEEDIPYVCTRLRADGGREGFFLAAKICP